MSLGAMSHLVQTRVSQRTRSLQPVCLLVLCHIWYRHGCPREPVLYSQFVSWCYVTFGTDTGVPENPFSTASLSLGAMSHLVQTRVSQRTRSLQPVCLLVLCHIWYRHGCPRKPVLYSQFVSWCYVTFGTDTGVPENPFSTASLSLGAMSHLVQTRVSQRTRSLQPVCLLVLCHIWYRHGCPREPVLYSQFVSWCYVTFGTDTGVPENPFSTASLSLGAMSHLVQTRVSQRTRSLQPVCLLVLCHIWYRHGCPSEPVLYSQFVSWCYVTFGTDTGVPVNPFSTASLSLGAMSHLVQTRVSRRTRTLQLVSIDNLCFPQRKLVNIIFSLRGREIK